MKKLYDYLVTQGVTPNGYYVLHATKHGYYHEKYVNIRTEQHRLSLSGHLLEEDSLYKLTSKSEDLLKSVDKLQMQLAKKIKNVPYGTWTEEIQKFNDMFPKGRRDGSTIAYRTNPKELHERFCWFFETYPEYNWEIVLEATRKYVGVVSENDVRFLQTSKYFIKKQDKNLEITSTLGSLCWNITEGNDNDISTEGYHYFGP